MLVSRSLALVLCGLSLVPTAASADAGRALQLAKLGVQLAGHNYATYAACDAAPDKLRAFKEKSRTRFPLVGGGFEALFAAGQADGKQYWAHAVADLGEAKAKSSVCPNSLQHLDVSLARK